MNSALYRNEREIDRSVYPYAQRGISQIADSKGQQMGRHKVNRKRRKIVRPIG